MNAFWGSLLKHFCFRILRSFIHIAPHRTQRYKVLVQWSDSDNQSLIVIQHSLSSKAASSEFRHRTLRCRSWFGILIKDAYRKAIESRTFPLGVQPPIQILYCIGDTAQTLRGQEPDDWDPVKKPSSTSLCLSLSLSHCLSVSLSLPLFRLALSLPLSLSASLYPFVDQLHYSLSATLSISLFLSLLLIFSNTSSNGVC